MFNPPTTSTPDALCLTKALADYLKGMFRVGLAFRVQHAIHVDWPAVPDLISARLADEAAHAAALMVEAYVRPSTSSDSI